MLIRFSKMQKSFCIFQKMFHTKLMEERIIIGLQSISNVFLDVVFQGISYVASWLGAIFLFLVIIIFVNKKFGFVFGGGFLFTIGFNYLLKVIVNRPRPFEINEQIVNKLQTIGKSFPSGHMVSATFIVFTLFYLFKKLNECGKFKLWNKKWFKIISIVFGVAFIVLTAISRMYLGQHYLSDIFVGIIVAVFGFFATLFVFKKIEKRLAK